MRWQKLFMASFEESLNLQDDKISGDFAKKQYKSAQEKEKYRGTLKSYIWLFILTIIFVFGLNYLFALVNNYMYYYVSASELTLERSEYNFLPYSFFWTLSFIWLGFILIGKRFNSCFILIYRGHFHIFVTYVLWLILELNLVSLTMFYKSFTILGTVSFFVLLTLLSSVIIRNRIISLLELVYHEPVKKTKLDNWLSKFISFVFKYGWGFVLAGLLLKFIFPSSTGVRTDWIGYIGILVVWFILDIAIIAFETYLIFPYMLQGYYKWKYPEEYREWEGKTPEEWYGEKYLKKQEERKKRNGRK